MALVANDGTVKYGIVGVGMMGREHLINLYHLRSQNVGVVAIADPHVPSQQLAVESARSFGWPLEVIVPPNKYAPGGMVGISELVNQFYASAKKV